MKRWVAIILAIVVGALVGGYFLLRPRVATAPVAEKPLIVTTILPLTVVVKNIVGETATVRQLVPSGASPHEFSFTPQEMLTVQKAAVVIKIGLQLDDWVDDAVPAGVPLINLGTQLSLPAGADPHLWLSPKKMISVTEIITRELSRILPQTATAMQKQGTAYQEKLGVLDQNYIRLRSLANKDFVSFHKAFTYLVEDYGLHCVGVIEETPGQEPTPVNIAQILQTLRARPLAALFGEPNVAPAILSAIARDAGRVVYILDSMERGSDAPEAYEKLMNKNLQVLNSALNK